MPDDGSPYYPMQGRLRLQNAACLFYCAEKAESEAYTPETIVTPILIATEYGKKRIAKGLIEKLGLFS